MQDFGAILSCETLMQDTIYLIQDTLFLIKDRALLIGRVVLIDDTAGTQRAFISKHVWALLIE